MFKKLLIIQSVLIILFLNMSSSFVYAGFFSDHIQTNTVPAPSVPYDDSLFNGEISTDIDSDYLNSDHLVEGETETELFDEKSEFHTTVDAPSTSNSSKSTNDELKSPASNIANSTKTKEYIMRDDSQTQQSDEYGIMPISYIDDYNFVPPFISQFTKDHNCHFIIDNPNNLVDVLKGKFGSQYDISYSLYSHYITSNNAIALPSYDDFINHSIICVDNLVVYKHTVYFGGTHDEYGFIFADSDIQFNSKNNDCNVYDMSNVIYCQCFGGYGSKGQFVGYSLDSLYGKLDGVGAFASGSFFVDFTPVYIGKNIDVYIDDVKQEKYNEDGTLAGDIKGEFKLNEKSNILSYRAYSDKVLDKTYDIHLWAVDNDSVPAKINGSENFPIRDLNTYLDHDLQLSSNKQSVKASINLEDVYYYLHQMNGYDGSIESVNGYEFDKFESRENIIFAIAYRESKSSLDWIVCKSYKYNYRDLIENVMGGFSVKKDYVDFPSLSDYVEGFPSIEDFLPDDEDPGILDWILAFIKWIANCVYIGFKNFIGLFQWLFDCIPILWENLTIALYNLVCDLKELVLYFVYPKTESIYAMANERCPAFKQLYSAVSQDASSSSLPSFIFFGTKFSLNLNDYGIDFSYVKSISQVIIWIFYFWCIWCIIRKVIGLAPSDGGDS